MTYPSSGRAAAPGAVPTVHYFSRRFLDHGPRSGFNTLDSAVLRFLRHPPPQGGSEQRQQGRGVEQRQQGAAGGGHEQVVAAPQPPQSPQVVLDGEMLVWNKER